MKRNLLIPLLLWSLVGVGCGIKIPPVILPPPPPVPSPTPAPTHAPGLECAAFHLTMGCWDLPPGSPKWVWVCVHQFAGGPTPSVDRPGLCPCPRSQTEIETDGGATPACPVVPPTPPPPPVAEGCRAPQGNWVRPEASTTFARADVLKVERELAGCTEGSDCPLPVDNQQSWIAKVAAELRKRGLCAGQHEDGVTDEIAVQPQGWDPALRWEAYKIYNCGPTLPSDPPNFDICPLKGRGKVRWAVASDSWSAPEGATQPPAPSPAPTPPPSAAECPLQFPLPQPYSVGLRVETHGTSGQQYDATPFVMGPSSAIPPPGWTGACRTQQCDLSPEKDPTNGLLCTIQLCDAVTYTIEPPSSAFINWQDGYLVKITKSGQGILVGRCTKSGAEGRRAF